jgi:hypothetical protein
MPTVERVPQQQTRQGPEGAPQTPKAPEQPFELTAEELLAVEPQQHVERSAWHSIVTEHGHEVSDAIQYGQEFHRQREHEMLQDRVGSSPSAGSGGGAVGQQDQPMLPQPYQQGTLPSGMTSPALPPGHPSHVDPQHQLPAFPQKQASNVASPWFWLMLALVIAAFFTAALI